MAYSCQPVLLPVCGQGSVTVKPFLPTYPPRSQPRVSHIITHLGRSGSVDGTGLVNLCCCSWRKTTEILGRRPGSAVCSIKGKDQGPRGHHTLALGTLQKPAGHFLNGPGSTSNWNCTPFSTCFPSGSPLDPDTWSWSHLASPGHLSIKRGGGRHQVMEEELSSHFPS